MDKNDKHRRPQSFNVDDIQEPYDDFAEGKARAREDFQQVHNKDPILIAIDELTEELRAGVKDTKDSFKKFAASVDDLAGELAITRKSSGRGIRLMSL